MSRKSFAIHRSDTTAKALIEEAEALGAQYLNLGGVLDGILFFRGRTILVDWKSPKGKLTPRQQRLVDESWPIQFISTSDRLREVLFAIPDRWK